MNIIHLEKFRTTEYKNDLYVGANANQWAKYVLGRQYAANSKLDGRMSRSELFKFCKNAENSNLETILAILAWGGMHREHGKKLMVKPQVLESLIVRLRNQDFSDREEAFHEFQKYRFNNELPGLGIGYFTKLICFLQPSLKGYIMDQWVAKSLNLLYGDKIVKITNNWVCDKNNCNDYESFCSCIDKLGQRLNLSGLETEERLFSIGGKKKGTWRAHVIENYR